MSNVTQERPVQTGSIPNAETSQVPANLPRINGPRLPYHPAIKERFGIDQASWKALVEAVFPNATSVESVILALSYCRARKLDPFKRNVHIVPIWNKDKRCMVDTIWPGIGELRTTAFRTGEYAGRGETEFGPDITRRIGNAEMTFPEWARVTVYRLVKGVRCEFSGPKVYWLETYAEYKRDDETPNEMWRTRPRGQIDKCAEAAALRSAFPEEIGTDYVADEVQHVGGAATGRVIETTKGGNERLLQALDSSPASEHSATVDAVADGGEESQEQQQNDGGPTKEDIAGTVDHSNGQQQTQQTQSPGNLDDLPKLLEACKTLKDVNSVQAECSKRSLDDAMHNWLAEACDVRREQIREASKK